MSGEIRAVLIAALLVVFAAGIGVTVGQQARPTPTPRPAPSPTVAVPSATPLDPAEVQRRAFAQPLVAGCATARAVWIIADGGAAIRWDGRSWTMPDPTLRSLLAARCDAASVLAVGRGGTILTVDDELRQVRPDRLGIEDFFGVTRFTVGRDPARALAVGAAGTVASQTEQGWEFVPTGVPTDLHSAAHKGLGAALQRPPFAWIVGAAGVTYRLMEQGRWERVETNTSATLRSVLFDTGGALAVGEKGTILRYSDGEARWSPLPSGTEAELRAIALVGLSTAWIVGDRGTVLELSNDSVRRIDLGTTCTLRDVFADGSAVWVIGSDGTRGGAWRIATTGTDRWGTC